MQMYPRAEMLRHSAQRRPAATRMFAVIRTAPRSGISSSCRGRPREARLEAAAPFPIATAVSFRLDREARSESCE